MTNKLIILVGPKGSGKSHIGRELDHLFGIKYIRIESVWQDLKERRSDFLSPAYIQEGRKLTLELIKSSLEDTHVCIEATGVGDDWDDYIAQLNSLAEIIFIKIICNLSECRKRAFARDQLLQVQIPEALFEEINQKAEKVELGWSAIINNNPFITSNELNSIMSPIFKSKHLI